MTRRTLISFVCMLLAVCALAKPPRRGLNQYRQPDGSLISITLHGDEFSHYATDASGNCLELDANGFYRIASFGPRKNSVSQHVRSNAGKRGAYLTTGERHIPVLLIEFADVQFSFENPQEMFWNLLNQEGYAYEGATGSVRDYYMENSGGQFIPVFDVLEPVRLEKGISTYGGNTVQGNDRAPELALYEACLALDEKVDFSVYDMDEDHEIDLILYFFAGYDEAEYGPADAIWSHQWSAQESPLRLVTRAQFDGKKLGRYICSSELSGNTGAVLTGIGTTCHEFAHALGLPDFYDTNGSEDGVAGGMYEFSTMCLGIYNNNSATPPYFNRLERAMLGWAEADIPELPEGDIVIGPVYENAGYVSPTSMEGEFFMWEARDGTGWDEPLPKGLLVYHIDQSETLVGDMPASILWQDWAEYNNLNANASHPLAYLIPSSSQKSLNYTGPTEGIIFPGMSRSVFLDLKDWNKVGTEYKVADIRQTEAGLRAYIVKGHDSAVTGTVLSLDGEPVNNALVGIDITEQPTVSDSQGHFVLDLPEGTKDVDFRLSVSSEGYRRTVVDGRLKGRSAYVPVSMMKTGESEVSELRKWDLSATKIFYPLPSKDYGDCMGAVRFTEADLFPYTGRRLEEVSFYNYVSTGSAEALYVIVDFGEDRVLTMPVEDPQYGVKNLNVVNIADANLRIPEGVDVYVGYGVKGSSYMFPLAATLTGSEGNSYFGPLDLEKSSWEPLYSDRSPTGYMDLLVSAGVREVLDDSSVSEMGYATIDLGGNNWKAGESFPLKLNLGSMEPATVTWLFDGEIALEESVELSKGVHTIKAIVKYNDKVSENLKAIITCE